MSLLPGVAERLQRHAKAQSRRLAAVPVSLARASTRIKLVDSPPSADEWLHELRSVDLSAIALDTEYGFDRAPVPLNRGDWSDVRSQRPVCASVAAWAQDGSAEGFVLRSVLDVRQGAVVDALWQALGLRVPFVFHHAKVDLFSLWALGLDPDLHQLYDTFLAASALTLGRWHKRSRQAGQDESEAEAIHSETALEDEKKHRRSLVGQCAHYGLGYPFSQSKDGHRARFLRLGHGEPLSAQDIEYAAADAEWTLRLFVAQQADLLRAGLHTHLETIEFPFAVANARMEWRGVHVQPDHLHLLREGAQVASEHYASVLRGQGVDPPGSRDRFLDVMREAGLLEEFRQKGKLAVTDDTLRHLDVCHPAIRPFRLHRHFRRLANEEWVCGSLIGTDGRIHASLKQLGSDTGRIACSRPNFAGLDRILRPVVTAPPGRALLELDYSQIEVGVAGAEHDDLDLVDAFNSGDVYAAMAQRFYEAELTPEELALDASAFKAARKDLRSKIKVFVLAVIYNMQAPTIATRFGVSVREAEHQRERFLTMFPTLRAALGHSADYGAVRGYASVVSGLRRRRDRRGRATNWTRNFLRNTPIQGSAAVVFKRAIIDLERAFRGSSTWMVLPVHDAVLIECDQADVDEVRQRACRLMEEAVRSYYPALRPRVDVNDVAPWCWNKDGQADSLERFLDDPAFSLDGPAIQEDAQQRAEIAQGLFEFEMAWAAEPTAPSAVEVRLLELAGLDADTFAGDTLLGLLQGEIELAEERAGILEFERGLARSEAEAQAARAVEGLVRQLLGSAGHAEQLAEVQHA